MGETEYGEGSYVLRMDQPYSRMADMLLDFQYYNPADPSPYDDVGWTLGPLFNVTTDRVEDTSILDARMQLVEGPVTPPSAVRNRRNAQAFLIDYAGEGSLAGFAFANPDLHIHAAESSFEVDGQEFNAGTFIVEAGEDPGTMATTLQTAAEEFGFVAYGVEEVPDVPVHHVGTPRVAVMHTWTTTQQEGWLRVGLDEFEIPYDYISVHEARDMADLKSQWDVIIMGPTTTDALSLISWIYVLLSVR